MDFVVLEPGGTQYTAVGDEVEVEAEKKNMCKTIDLYGLGILAVDSAELV